MWVPALGRVDRHVTDKRLTFASTKQVMANVRDFVPRTHKRLVIQLHKNEVRAQRTTTAN